MPLAMYVIAATRHSYYGKLPSIISETRFSDDTCYRHLTQYLSVSKCHARQRLRALNRI